MHDALSAQSDAIREQERVRIAREIHDELGGNLIAIKIALSQLNRNLPDDNDKLQAKASYLDELVDRTIDAIHRITADLRSAALDLGLVGAIVWQISEFEKQSGIKCHWTANEEKIDLSLERTNALFKIAQEAFTNISKHAQANQVTVALLREGDTVRLQIADDGRGISPTDRVKPQSFGIRGMVERMTLVGGTILIEAGRHGGTMLSVSMPINDE